VVVRIGIGPKRVSRAANKASNGKPFVYDELLARMRAVLRLECPALSACTQGPGDTAESQRQATFRDWGGSR
jgi:hypothetical protein